MGFTVSIIVLDVLSAMGESGGNGKCARRMKTAAFSFVLGVCAKVSKHII